MGSQRVGHDWATKLSAWYTHAHAHTIKLLYPLACPDMQIAATSWLLSTALQWALGCGHLCKLEFSLNICPEVVTLFLVFEKLQYCSPEWLLEFTFPPAVWEGSLFSTASPAFIVCRPFDDGHPGRCEVVTPCGFDSRFSSNEWCWVPFTVPLGHLDVFSGDVSIWVWCPWKALSDRTLRFCLGPCELGFPVKAPIQYSVPPQEGTWLSAQRVHLAFLRAEDRARISCLPQTFVLIHYSCPHSLHSLLSNESRACQAWGQWSPALSRVRDLKLLGYLTHTPRHPDVFNMGCILGPRILKDSSRASSNMKQFGTTFMP